MNTFKNKYFRNTLCALSIGIALQSCKLRETNVNPNASTNAPLSAILTGAEASLGFSIGADANPISNIFVQQFSGANGDATGFENYTSTSGRYDVVWSDIYPTSLNNLAIIKQKAKAGNNPYYAGIAKILLAYGFGTLTDLYGDIPYSDALKGLDSKAPKYDAQEFIYKSIQEQLDSAIVELSLPTNNYTSGATGNLAPSTDDVIYKGDVKKWIAAAWTLKARYALHLSKLNATDAANKALEYLGANGTYRGIASNANDLQVNFTTSTTNSNPYYQISVNRAGWLTVNASFANLLNGNKISDSPDKAPSDTIDPRRSFFIAANSAGKYKGYRTGGNNNEVSNIGPFFNTPTGPVIFASYAEAKFIEAEARLILNNADPKILEKLKEGIQASFAKVITSSADTNATLVKQTAYINKRAVLTGDFQKDLNTIITQKYIALFTQGEVWVDYRRTGYPVLPLVQGGTNNLNPNGEIPRRFLYPSNEQLLNPNIPTKGSTYQNPRLWWDQ